jgi:hypothetical protein
LSAAGQQIAGQLEFPGAWELRVESRPHCYRETSQNKLQAKERSGEQLIDPPHQREIVVIAA